VVSLSSVFGADVRGFLLGPGLDVALIVLLSVAIWLVFAAWVEKAMGVSGVRRRTLLAILQNGGKVFIILATVAAIAQELGVPIAPLIASAGVLGVALAFGAQKMAEDVITGIILQFENAVNVGDVVEAGGKVGVVEKLTIRSISLRDLQGVYHLIPFSSVGAISNYMKGFAYHVADIGIAYKEDIDEAKAEMTAAFETLRAMPEEGHKIIGPFEWFGVQSLGDNAVTLRARIMTRAGDQWGIGRLYNELVKKRFDAADIEIPFPQQTVWAGTPKHGTPPRLPQELGPAAEVEPQVSGE